MNWDWNIDVDRFLWPVAGLAFVGLAVWWMGSGGCQTTAPPAQPAPRPPASPKLLSSELQSAIFGDNEMAVTVRNDGKEGWVEVRVDWYTSKDTRVRGESGVEEAFREAFTRDKPPPDSIKTNTSLSKSWKKRVWLSANESKALKIQLPEHSVWPSGYLSVDAKGTFGQPPSNR